MQFSDQFVCRCGNDCAGRNHVTAIAPGIPDTREREGQFVIQLKVERPLLLCRSASIQKSRLLESSIDAIEKTR